MANATAQASSPVAPQAPAPAIPFPLASRRMTRFSFSTINQALSTASPTPLNPIQVPAVGYLSGIMLEVTASITSGASAAAYTADAPFNLLQSTEFRTAAGNDIIVPYTGYQLYLANKYGAQFTSAPYTDPRLGRQYSAPTPVASGAVTVHFFLYVPLEIDLGTGYGSIPALASNRSYQINFILAALSTVAGANATAGSVQINGTAFYWSEPPATTASGNAQAVSPAGIGTVSQWQVEMPPVTPGDKLIKSNNVGNVIRTLIFVLRTAAGARTDADWPGVSELYLDNEPMFYFQNTLWEEFMIRNYGFTASAKDTAQGLDTGVYVMPFSALAGDLAGSMGNSRAQLLPTVDGSQLQLRGTSFGSNASTLEILTNSVIPTDAVTLYSR